MLAHPNPWDSEHYGSDALSLRILENAKLGLVKSINLKLDVGLIMCHKAKHGYAF